MKLTKEEYNKIVNTKIENELKNIQIFIPLCISEDRIYRTDSFDIHKVEYVLPNTEIYTVTLNSGDDQELYGKLITKLQRVDSYLKAFRGNLKIFLYRFFYDLYTLPSYQFNQEGDVTTISIAASSGSSRSFAHIYSICKSFDTSITIDQLRETLVEMIKEGGISSFICNGIIKRVFFKPWIGPTEIKPGNYFNNRYDEFGYDWGKVLDLKSLRNPSKYTGNELYPEHII